MAHSHEYHLINETAHSTLGRGRIATHYGGKWTAWASCKQPSVGMLHPYHNTTESLHTYTEMARPPFIICGLSNGHCRFHKRPPCLLILCSMTDSCQTYVKWSDIRFNCAKPILTRSA